MVYRSQEIDATDASAIIKRLLKATTVKTAAALAEVLSVTPQAISSAKKKNKIPSGWVDQVADQFGVSRDWIISGCEKRERGEAPNGHVCTDDTELVMVPMVEARLAAGSGSFETGGEVSSRYAFRNEFLSRRGNPDQMVMMRVMGDSMEPEIKNDDTVLIDQSQTRPGPGQVFAVGVEDLVYLKMIDTLPGKILLKSYNPAYPPIEVDTRGDLKNGIRIIGHVVWVGRELP